MKHDFKYETAEELKAAVIMVSKTMNGCHVAEVMTILGVLVGHALTNWPKDEREDIFDTIFRDHVFNKDPQ